jgi:hypothetical protein
MADAFTNHQPGLDSPGSHAAVITPHDTNDLAAATRAIVIGTGGDLEVITVGGETVVLPNVPAGILPLRVTRVLAGNTTASDLTAIW